MSRPRKQAEPDDDAPPVVAYSELLDLEQERALEARARRHKIELELALAQGVLTPTAVARNVWAEIIKQLVSSLARLPDDLATEFGWDEIMTERVIKRIDDFRELLFQDVTSLLRNHNWELKDVKKG